MNVLILPQISLWAGAILIIWGLKMYTCTFVQVRNFTPPLLKTRLLHARFRPLEAFGS